MGHCTNCGADLAPLDDVRYCVYFDKHNAGNRPPLCRACYAKDGGGCWHCELDILIEADGDPLPPLAGVDLEPTEYPEPTYNPDEETTDEDAA